MTDEEKIKMMKMRIRNALESLRDCNRELRNLRKDMYDVPEAVVMSKHKLRTAMKSMDNGWGMFDNMEVWILDIAYELGSAFLNCELQRLAMGEIAIGEEGKEG